MTITGPGRPGSLPEALRHGWLILAVALLLLLVIVLAGLAAYDASRGDDIAEGISVAGVDLGGLSAAEARSRLRRQLVRPLRTGVEVEWRGRSFRLSGNRARVDADIAGSVRRAVARSREGVFVGRALRDLAGAEVEARDIPARVSYSRAAVAALVRRVKRKLDRPARDARVDPSPGGLRKVRPRAGRAVRAGVLRRKVVHALLHRASLRVVTPSFAVTRPRVTTGQLAARHPWYITIDRGSFTLRLFRRLRLLETYEIAVGQAGFDSPPGLHRILDKQVNPAWNVPNKSWAGELAGRVIPPGDPKNPLKARWMAYAPGGFGIHGTAETGSLGSRASHGCIRMSVSDVVELYSRVPVGTPVYLGG